MEEKVLKFVSSETSAADLAINSKSHNLTWQLLFSNAFDSFMHIAMECAWFPLLF